ncbi:cytochrome P450 [Marasmius fiardii PR-910]|nr:cytochrome P450 [Marasmius fiardii PR-910]
MTTLTPGVRLLSLWFFVFSAPSIISYAIYKTDLFSYLNLHLPSWAYIGFAVLCLPTVLFIHVISREVRQRTEAHKMGARLAPRVAGKWLGNLDVIVMMHKYWQHGYPGDGLVELCETKGPVFNMNALWNDMIFTTSPEHIQAILATNFPNYVKGERFQKNMRDMLGIGVFNADGEMWKFHRQMTRPFFTRDRITHFELFDKHAETVVAVMKARLRERVPLDFQDLMGKFTLDSATEFLFGSCVNNLASPLPYPHRETSHYQTTRADEFAKAFLEAQEGISARERLGPVWPLLEIFEDKVKRPMKIVSAFVDPIIAEAIAKKKAGLRESKEKIEDVGEDETLLDHLVDITDDPVVLKDATLNIMIAGRDTTAATLTFIVYFLATHPHVTARLRQEVLEAVGTAGEKRNISWEIVKEMKYLRAVINETLRLYPVVPFNVRESINATTWSSPEPDKPPIYIPAGAKTPYSVFIMHRRKDLWGPDADVFDPDRFLDHRLKKYLAPKPFIFLPFNAGPRICLGQQFAYNEMSLMLIRLLQNFQSFTFLPESAPLEFQTPAEWQGLPGRKGIDRFFPKSTLTMYSAGGLWIEAQEADSEAQWNH